MGALMVWGTAILFFDCILIILLYERSRAWFGDRLLPRLALSGALVLSFDQLAFFAGLNMLTGAALPVLVGGWVAEDGRGRDLQRARRRSISTVSSGRAARPNAPRIADVFDLLTYRERYEDLLARTGRDALTGALDRGIRSRRTAAARSSMPPLPAGR